MLAEEALERAAVGLETVARNRRLSGCAPPDLLLDKGQRDLRRRSVVEAGERDLFDRSNAFMSATGNQGWASARRRRRPITCMIGKIRVRLNQSTAAA